MTIVFLFFDLQLLLYYIILISPVKKTAIDDIPVLFHTKKLLDNFLKK
jgi:hypothetical protein